MKKARKRMQVKAMTDTMTLELEKLDELFNLFEGDEDKCTVAVGQLNSTNEESLSINIVVTMRAMIEEGDTLISYTEPMGTALIPYDILKEGGKKAVQEYETRKPKYDALLAQVKEKRHQYILKIQGKGYNVINGVWML